MGKFRSPRVVPRERVRSPKFESRRVKLLRDGCACVARVKLGMRNVHRVHVTYIWSWYRVELRVGDHLGRSEELVSRCVECDLAEPESLASLGGSAPGVVDGILSFVFDVNGHFTKKPMATVYSGMFLAEPTNLELWGADAGHAYNLQALTREKLYTMGGPECWHHKSFEILHQMGFKPSRADPDTWIKYPKDGSHYEYIVVDIDDLAIHMEDPKSFCDKLREVAPLNYHLGCGYTRDEDNPTNTLSKHWKYASI